MALREKQSQCAALIALIVGGVASLSRGAVAEPRAAEWEESPLVSAELLAPEQAGRASFGFSLAVAGAYALVGAPGFSENEQDMGRVFAFERKDAQWTELEPIAAPSGARGWFGASLAISIDTFLIGSPDFSATSAAPVWSVPRAARADGHALPFLPGTSPSPLFGTALAVQGSTLLVGDPGDLGEAGQVIVHRWENDAWQPQQALPNAEDSLALTDSSFGWSLVLAGDQAIIGAPFSDGGAVYVFARSSEGGAYSLLPGAIPAPAGSVYFGNALAFDAEAGVLAVADNGIAGDAGAAHLYRWDGSSWVGQPPALGSGNASADYFGQSLTATRGAVLVGAPGKVATGGESGAVLAFVGDAEPKLLASRSQLGGTLSSSAEGIVLATTAQNGVFAYTLALGVACGPSVGCDSGHCTDGVCCETVCDGACESCRDEDTGSAPGACAPVLIGTDPDRDCSELDARCSRQTCDGNRACAAEPSGTPCTKATCVDPSTAMPAASCDGEGQCVDAKSVVCEQGSMCSAGECLPEEPPRRPTDVAPTDVAPTDVVVACSSGADCASIDGAYCLEGRCVTGKNCATEQNAAYDEAGGVTECVRTRCAFGACLLRCELTRTDCADGYWCDPDTHTCLEAAELSALQAGVTLACSVGAGGNRAGPSPLPLLALATGLCLRRLVRGHGRVRLVYPKKASSPS